MSRSTCTGSITDLLLRLPSPAQNIAFWRIEDWWVLSWNQSEVEHHALQTLPTDQHLDLPFTTGAVGYFGYDYGAFQMLEIDLKQSSKKLPDTFWLDVQQCVLQKDGSSQLHCINYDSAQIDKFLRQKAPDASWSLTDWNLGSEEDWGKGFDQALEQIRIGEIYQLNLTTAFSARCQGNKRQLFLDLYARTHGAESCYLETPEWELLSVSPELFVECKGQRVITRPIKGTSDKAHDLNADKLLDDTKEAAELHMITDLLRNDLRLSGAEEIVVHALRELQELPHLWHTYSEISGQLPAYLTHHDVVTSMLPGGSISGCPKHRACQIIDQLEPHVRGPHFGSFGWFGNNGQSRFNILIRTLVAQGDSLELQVGGGLTFDSDKEQEWQEVLQKAQPFLDLSN